MAYRPINIFGPGQPTSSGAQTLYTNPSGRTTVVKEMLLANNSTAGVGIIKIGIGGVNSSQLIVPDVVIAAKSTGEAVDNLIILAASLAITTSGTTIQAKHSSAKRVTLTISGEASS